MKSSINIPPDSSLCGTWRCKTDDTSDYPGAQYTVTIEDEIFKVTGVDTLDGELFIITDLLWNGICLVFHAYMESTGRSSINQVRYIGSGEVEFTFTFTEQELWTRIKDS